METQVSNKKYKHKVHFCIYCKEDIKRIHEHFLRKHKDEIRVKEIICTGDKIRRFWLWKKLTQEGDNFYNRKTDDIIGKKKIVKELQKESKKKKYYDCSVCFGRIRTSSKCHHEKLCKKIFQNNKEANGINGNYQDDIFHGAPEYLINKIRGSKYLMQFLFKIFQEKGKDVRKSLRTIMKDLITVETEMNKFYNKNDTDLISFFKSEKIDGFIASIRKLSGEEKHEKNLVFR